MNPDILRINLFRAGEFFMHSLWIQGQMVDLLILKQHPEIHNDFISNPATVPNIMSTTRAGYWTKDFDPIRKEFLSTFVVSQPHEQDLDAIYHLRNAIAHCHVSMGREYFLYRPRGEAKEQSMITALNLTRKSDEANPLTLKLAFDDEAHYIKQFARLQRLDSECFLAIAKELQIPHSRIR